MNAEHPFAAYVRILGRGRTLSRSLTMEDAEQAMAMILRGEARPEQIGAFLMLLRVKEETPEEIAGFVRGARATFTLPEAPVQVDLDWSSYAGKRRQLPWFLLAALTLAQDGVQAPHGGGQHGRGQYVIFLVPGRSLRHGDGRAGAFARGRNLGMVWPAVTAVALAPGATARS